MGKVGNLRGGGDRNRNGSTSIQQKIFMLLFKDHPLKKTHLSHLDGDSLMVEGQQNFENHQSI